MNHLQTTSQTAASGTQVPRALPDPGAPDTTAADMLDYPGMQEALAECIANEYEEHVDMSDTELKKMVEGVGRLLFRP